MFRLLISILFLSSICLAQNPEQILKMALETLPQKKLNVEFVVKVGIQKSSSFQSIESLQLDSQSTDLESLGKYDWTFLANYNYLNQKKDVASPFEPEQIKQDTYGIGLKKYFSTGTSFETELGRSYNEIFFSTPGINIPKYEDRLSFTITQNLWADAFGKSSRAEVKSIQLRSRAEQINYAIAQQNWAMQLIQLYNSAWLSQQQYFAALENAERRQRLVQVTKNKLSKGTSEKQDFLQVQSAELASQNQLSKATSQLNETWKSLVIQLGLPIEWLVIQPEKIPMILSGPEKLAQSKCLNPISETETYEVQKADLNKKSADEGLIAAKSKNSPQLQLVGGYNTNGIAATQQTAQKENFDATHPSWNVGLQLQIPLEGRYNQSGELRATAQQIRSQNEYISTLDNKKIEFITLCEKLKSTALELKNSEQAFKNQQERLELEEKRFRIGRSTTFSVIQAGDDKTFAEQQYQQTQAEYKDIIWQILKSTSELHNLIKEWVK